MEPLEIWSSDFDVTFPAEVIRQFRSLCLQFRPDVIVLESLPLFNLVVVAKECARAVIIDLHNVESDLVAQEVGLNQNLEAVLRIEAQAKRIRALEQRATSLADVAWVCSSVDRDRLVRNGTCERQIAVVPNGIPRAESVQPRPQRNHDRSTPVLLFLAHLGYPPNIDAALFLVELMPVLWRHLADARLILAGRNPHPAVVSKSKPGKIDVIADPGSTSSLLLSADLAVMPLQRGGGTRIKALEAMAWGLPIVATARAVEGLQLQDGVHVSIAETRSEFVAAICALCVDSVQYESQYLTAQKHLMTCFGPEVVRAAVYGGLRQALSN
jgi:glycosyltransferase involved in cell wall biosynthesis